MLQCVNGADTACFKANMTLHFNRNAKLKNVHFATLSRHAESDKKQHLNDIARTIMYIVLANIDKHVKLAVLIVMNITVSYMHANLMNCAVLDK